MANVWSDQTCPGCGKLVEDQGILVASVNVTTKDAYQCYRKGSRLARPLFQKGGGSLWHSECLPQGVVK